MAKYTIEIEDAPGGVMMTATGGTPRGEESAAASMVVAIMLSANSLRQVADDMARQGVVVPAARKQNVH